MSRAVVRDVALGGVFVAVYNLAWVGLIAAISGDAGLSAFFSFPSGSIWSNLLASAMVAAVVVWRMAKNHAAHLALARKQHAEKLAADDSRHREALAQAQHHHEEQLARQADQHRKVLDHITANRGA